MLYAQSVTYLYMLDTLEKGLCLPWCFALQQGDNGWKIKTVTDLDAMP